MKVSIPNDEQTWPLKNKLWESGDEQAPVT